MAYDPNDYYYRQAKKEKYAARSVFKLQEIDQRLRVFKSGQKVLDLGAAPGSWSQYVSPKIGPRGKILGIDLKAIQITLPNALFVQADLNQLDLNQTLEEQGIAPPFDVVMSDMAPQTTGFRLTDQMGSLALCELALDIAKKNLKEKGTFICKLFHSSEFEEFRSQLKQVFQKVESIRPKSTRKESKEIFLIALGFLGLSSP